MMEGLATLVRAGVPFVWFGMVLALSFLEAPLKFCAPGMTRQLALGLGRLVFCALASCEIVLFGLLSLCFDVVNPHVFQVALLMTLFLILVAQNIFLRPALDERAVTIIAGQSVEASNEHLYYVALECFKLGLLLVLGVEGIVGGG
jgi:hypothetical protein